LRFLIDIGHPAHVHLFKHFIWRMKARGHKVLVTAREKDVTLQLLDAYKIEYVLVGRISMGTINLLKEWVQRDYAVYKIAKKFNPDFLLGTLNPVVAHISWLLKRPSVIFTDYEPSSVKYPLPYYLTVPFADSIITPTSIRSNYNNKSIKIPTYKEMAYLHPNVFTPDPSILDELGLGKNDVFSIIRFVSWRAHHDINGRTFSPEDKIKLVKNLSKFGPVFISSEGPLPSKIDAFKLTIFPHRIHDLLYYSRLLVCDSQTMATEAAVLGTPVIRCNSFVGKKDIGNFFELERKYGLIFNISDPKKAIEKAEELIQISTLKREWRERRERLLKDKIDLTKFMVWFIENHPQRFKKIKKNPKMNDFNENLSWYSGRK